MFDEWVDVKGRILVAEGVCSSGVDKRQSWIEEPNDVLRRDRESEKTVLTWWWTLMHPVYGYLWTLGLEHRLWRYHAVIASSGNPACRDFMSASIETIERSKQAYL